MTTATLCLLLAATFVAGVFTGSFIKGSRQSSPVKVIQQAPEQTAAPQQMMDPRGEASALIKDLEQRVLKNPSDRAALVELGNQYFDTDQYESAATAYEKALSLNGDDPDVLTDLGIMYRALHRHDEALQAFSKAIALDPHHQNALFNTGVVLCFDQGKKDEARKVWNSILTFAPDAKAPDGRSLKDLIQQLN